MLFQREQQHLFNALSSSRLAIIGRALAPLSTLADELRKALVVYLFRQDERAPAPPDVLEWLGIAALVPNAALIEEVLATIFGVSQDGPRRARLRAAGTPPSASSAFSSLTSNEM